MLTRLEDFFLLERWVDARLSARSRRPETRSEQGVFLILSEGDGWNKAKWMAGSDVNRDQPEALAGAPFLALASASGWWRFFVQECFDILHDPGRLEEVQVIDLADAPSPVYQKDPGGVV
jgi:hypothetical protein